MVPSNEPPRSPRRARRRWIRALGAIAALVAVVIGAALVLVHHLDHPWVKRRLLAFARGASGLDLDYASIRVSELHGARVEGLVVKTPAELAGAAPELARVEAIDVGWSPGSLVGPGPKLERVALHGVTVTVVVDEHGRTTFDAIPSSSPPSPPTPLSKLPASIFASPLPVGRVEIDGVALSLVTTNANAVVERVDLSGLAIALTTTRGAGGPGIEIAIGAIDAPREIEVVRTRDGAAKAARFALGFALGADAKAAHVMLGVDVRRQEFVEGIAPGEGLRLAANATFDGDAERTSISLEQAELGAGVASAKASVEIPDDGAPLVHHLEADVDLVKLVALAPAGLVPLTLGRGELHARIDELDVAAPGEKAAASIDMTASDVAFTAPGAEASVGSLRLVVRGKPEVGGGFAGQGTITIDALRARTGGATVAADELELQIDGARSGAGAWSGEVALKAARLGSEALGVEARDLGVALRSAALHLDSKAMFGVRGDVELDVSAASVDARRAAGVLADASHLHVRAPLPVAPPLAAEGRLELARVTLFDRRGHEKIADPLRLDFAIHDVIPDLDHPVATLAVAHVDVALGALRTSIDATKAADAVDYRLHATAATLADVGKLVEDGEHSARWERMSLVLDASGRADRIASSSPSLRQEAHVVASGVAFGDVATDKLDLTLSSNGTASRQEAKVDGRADALVLAGAALGEERFSATATVDVGARSLRLDLTNAGPAEVKLGATATIDGGRGAVNYEVTTDVAKLGPLAPLASKIHALAGFDLEKLAIHVASRGRALGVTAPDDKARPRDAFGVEAAVDADLHGVTWAHDDQSIVVDEGRLHAIIGGDQETHTIESHLDVDAMKVAFGRHEIVIRMVRDTLKAKLDKKVEEGEVSIDQRVTIEEVRQDIAPMYPIGKVEAHVVAARDDDGVIRIAEVKIENRAAGTSLKVSGGLELAEDRRRLSLRAEVQQDLARACTRRDLFVGSGEAAVTVRVESADLAVFRSKAVLTLKRANLALPGPGLKLSGVDGEIPVRADLHLGKDGVELLRDTDVNRYSVLRFSDQHPMLAARSFISVESIVTPAVTIAPFAANLEVAQNVVSLGQLELGLRGGRVTGQCIIQVAGEDSKIQAHLRANGVQSSHGEPFDGNAALEVSLGDRSVEGRAEILRIGRRHLLDLVDLQDPQRVDGSMNQIRRALGLGYPSHLRISFDHGFASASISFAGIASLLSVDDIRGVPMGALVDKTVRSIWKPQHHPR